MLDITPQELDIYDLTPAVLCLVGVQTASLQHLAVLADLGRLRRRRPAPSLDQALPGVRRGARALSAARQPQPQEPGRQARGPRRSAADLGRGEAQLQVRGGIDVQGIALAVAEH